MKQRILRLLEEMNRGIYEKEAEISLSLWAALAGESILLLGPPGVAKSMVARRLKTAFSQARTFEYLMSRFSTPDEIFGPVSIAKLKDSDSYVRCTDGYLPTADVVFLDEIWKAGPAIQNTLLTVINEKLFRNGNRETRLPLKLLVAASNELPAQGEGLEALWDRFIVRMESRPIGQDAHFNAMFTATDVPAETTGEWQITNAEYEAWAADIDRIGIGAEALQGVNMIRRALHTVPMDDADEQRDIYVSDRRWKKIARLLRTSALMHDRTEVAAADLLPLYHCLWQEPEERDAVRRIVVRALFAAQAADLGRLKELLDTCIAQGRNSRPAASKAAGRDADKRVYSNYYYRLPQHDTGHTFVVKDDYGSLPAYGGRSANGMLYQDPRNEKITVIRLNDGDRRMPVGCRPVSLARDETNLYIDGRRFELETQSVGTETLPSLSEADSERDFTARLEQIADALRRREQELSESLFITPDDRKEIADYVQSIYKEIAFTRQDLAKL